MYKEVYFIIYTSYTITNLAVQGRLCVIKRIVCFVIFVSKGNLNSRRKATS